MPKRATTLFSPDQKRDIERTIADAESKTSAEIVVAVATRSGRYDRAEDLAGLVLALLALAAAAMLLPIPASPDTWNAPWRIDLHPAVLLILLPVAAIAGAATATAIPALARPLVPRRHREEEVRRAGAAAFQTLRVRDTADANGLLIYVSLFEHVAWVVGDDAINKALDQADFDAIRDRIVQGFKRGRPGEALAEAVAMTGDLLADHFPRAHDDTSELPDTLHLLD